MVYSLLERPQQEEVHEKVLVDLITGLYYSGTYQRYYIYGDEKKIKSLISRLAETLDFGVYRENQPYRGEILTVADSSPTKKTFQWIKDQMSVLSTYQMDNTYGFVTRNDGESDTQAADRFFGEKLKDHKIAKVYHRMIPIIATKYSADMYAMGTGDDAWERMDVYEFILTQFKIIHLI